jgi:hypothetical protein
MSTTTTTAVFTRAASRIALTHVLDNILQRPNINSAHTKTGIKDTTDLLELGALHMMLQIVIMSLLRTNLIEVR